MKSDNMMKNYHLYHSTSLRNLCTGMLLCFLGSTNFAYAQDAVSEGAFSKDKQEKVERFFDRYLKLPNLPLKYSEQLTIPLNEVSYTQDKVWKLWKLSNQKFKEEKLIELKKLDKNNKGRWFLPSKLEPNAWLNYYYGLKGNDEKPAEGYPLFLYLHGSGNKNEEWENGFNLCMGFKDAPSAYFIPQIPNVNQYYRWWQKAKQFAWEKLLRLAFTDESINPNRIYFFGISEGGYGSQRLASFYADYLAGAGPMAGGEPLINAPVENCANLAFSLLTGEFDEGFFRNTLTTYTNDSFNALEKLYPGHFLHRVELVPWAYHGFDYGPTTPWLAQYTRQPHPKMVLWENFDMDGIRRKGFYNLYLEKDPAGKSNDRIYYAMNINENNITLDVRKVIYETTESQQGIGLKFKRTYEVVNSGVIRIYLNSELVNLQQPVRIIANGKLLFEDKVEPDITDMVNSCAKFFDPERVFPASVVIDLSQEETGIMPLEEKSKTAECYYNLGGKKVRYPHKGVFINNNGEKVIFR